MPQLIFASKGKLDGAVGKAAYWFLEKLRHSDASPGLHIEPIRDALYPRVRTGRVNDFWRAVLVRLQGNQGEDANYVYLGTYPHYEAIEIAKSARIGINPQTGIAEIIATGTDPSVVKARKPVVKAKPKPDDIDHTRFPLLETQGVSAPDLAGLGIDNEVAAAVLSAT
ncbi:MAG: hypothetical protein FWG25_01415 [Promicromonosporaceae bacterium]|nr:hypothetical protein [Promicromonosporaceae bacterium]